MRATLSFSAAIDDILSDTAHMLNRRVEVYGQADLLRTSEKISSRIEHATIEQLPDILADIAILRTQLAKLDFAMEDVMNIMSAYHQAMTTPAEEPTTNNEV